MRAPIAEKLAELRKQIERIEATPRKGFTPKQRQAVYDLFDGLCGCGCEEPLKGEKWDIDHVIPLALGGSHELSNWMPLIKSHHVEKTKGDVKSISKARRISRREEEGPKPSSIQSRGFQPRHEPYRWPKRRLGGGTV